MAEQIQHRFIDTVIRDIRNWQQRPDAMFNLFRMPMSTHEQLGTVMLIFIGYDPEKSEVYALGLPTSRSTDKYWQFLESELRHDRLPMMIMTEDENGFRVRIESQVRSRQNSHLLDHLRLEFERRKATPDQEDEQFIELVAEIMRITNKASTAGAGTVTD